MVVIIHISWMGTESKAIQKDRMVLQPKSSKLAH
jgi:hypothetical protein